MFNVLEGVLPLDNLYKLVDTGGPVVILLLVLSVFVTTIIILKIFQFLWIGAFWGRPMSRTIRRWTAGEREAAYQSVANSRNPTAKVVAHLMRGLQVAPDEKERIREDIERVADGQINSIRSYFRGIEAVVQTAPLIGLFGTVIGMIEAFRNMQGAGSQVDPAVLAGGIWVALLTTAVGLAIAIPAAFVLYWFESVADNEQQRMENAVTSILTERVTDKDPDTHNQSSSQEKISLVKHAT